MEEAMVLELLKQYQKQYRTALELERITKELEEAVKSNDRIALQLILELRQQSITQMQELRNQTASFLEGVDLQKRMAIEGLLKWPPDEMAESDLEKKLQETNRSIKNALAKAISIDRKINLKLGNKKSYYYDKENGTS